MADMDPGNENWQNTFAGNWVSHCCLPMPATFRSPATARKLGGASAEILNNWGYSYMLRGERARAREILLRAQAQDPGNPYVKNNLELLEAGVRDKKPMH